MEAVREGTGETIATYTVMRLDGVYCTCMGVVGKRLRRSYDAE